MAAIACLRIIVGEPPPGMSADALATLVSRVGTAYLETRWTWPRRYGQVAPFAFALADPRALRLDTTELQRLSAEIHVMLFGHEGAGEVAMLTLEGEQAEVMRFAAASTTALAALLAGRDDGTFKGRICKITPSGVVSLAPPGGPVDGGPAPAESGNGAGGGAGPYARSTETRIRWAGVYLPSRERFIGSIAETPMWDDIGALVPSEGEIMLQDMTCLRIGAEVMQDPAAGLVFIPLNFNGLIKPSLRQAYAPAVGALRPEWRPRLVASVYETPRAPSLNALKQIQTLLQPLFSLIDLQVVDPAFDIEGMPLRLVNAVSLLLAPAAERERLAAITRFAGQSQNYKLKRVLQGVAGVRTPRELELCRRLKVALVSGPAVSASAQRPWGDVSWPADQLPHA